MRSSHHDKIDDTGCGAPFRSTFNFKSPEPLKKLPNEIDNLLSASRRQHYLGAGATNLGHDAFKILKDTNLMRFQRETGEKNTNKAYSILRDEMLGRKKAFDESVTDYKQSLVKAHERKRAIQADNSAFWRQQSTWRKEREEAEHLDAQFDPEEVWNVETKDRRRL